MTFQEDYLIHSTVMGDIPDDAGDGVDQRLIVKDEQTSSTPTHRVAAVYTPATPRNAEGPENGNGLQYEYVTGQYRWTLDHTADCGASPALVAEWLSHWPRCTRARVRSPYGLRLECIPCG